MTFSGDAFVTIQNAVISKDAVSKGQIVSNEPTNCISVNPYGIIIPPLCFIQLTEAGLLLPLEFKLIPNEESKVSEEIGVATR